MLTFISLREMLTFIFLRSIKLATHQIPPEKNKNRAPILGHPSYSIEETLGPRHRPQPGQNSGPYRLASFRRGGHSGQGIRAQVRPGRNLGPRCSGPNSLGIDLPCPCQNSCAWALISPSLYHHLTSPCYSRPLLVCRYRLGLTPMARCCRSLRES